MCKHQCLLVLEGESTEVALLRPATAVEKQSGDFGFVPVVSVVDHVLLQGAEVGNILSTHGARETT